MLRLNILSILPFVKVRSKVYIHRLAGPALFSGCRTRLDVPPVALGGPKPALLSSITIHMQLSEVYPLNGEEERERRRDFRPGE